MQVSLPTLDVASPSVPIEEPSDKETEEGKSEAIVQVYQRFSNLSNLAFEVNVSMNLNVGTPLALCMFYMLPTGCK